MFFKSYTTYIWSVILHKSRVEKCAALQVALLATVFLVVDFLCNKISPHNFNDLSSQNRVHFTIVFIGARASVNVFVQLLPSYSLLFFRRVGYYYIFLFNYYYLGKCN